MRRHPEHLGDEEGQHFTAVLARCPELTALHGHVRTFAEILTTRSGQHLKDWVTATRADDLPGLHTFATGLEKDWDAVVQGLTTCWSSGPVEGRVNHIKMIKRQMFGRAKLPCVRRQPRRPIRWRPGTATEYLEEPGLTSRGPQGSASA